jgi:hypothetical protein
LCLRAAGVVVLFVSDWVSGLDFGFGCWVVVLSPALNNCDWKFVEELLLYVCALVARCVICAGECIIVLFLWSGVERVAERSDMSRFRFGYVSSQLRDDWIICVCS